MFAVHLRRSALLALAALPLAGCYVAPVPVRPAPLVVVRPPPPVVVRRPPPVVVVPGPVYR